MGRGRDPERRFRGRQQRLPRAGPPVHSVQAEPPASADTAHLRYCVKPGDIDLREPLEDAPSSEREEAEGHREPATSTVRTRFVESNEFVRFLAVDIALVVAVRGGLVPELKHVETPGGEMGPGGGGGGGG